MSQLFKKLIRTHACSCTKLCPLAENHVFFFKFISDIEIQKAQVAKFADGEQYQINSFPFCFLTENGGSSPCYNAKQPQSRVHKKCGFAGQNCVNKFTRKTNLDSVYIHIIITGLFNSIQVCSN